MPLYRTTSGLAVMPARTGRLVITRTTSRIRDPNMKLTLVCMKVPILAMDLLPITVYAAKVTAATSMRMIPGTVFPGSTFHGLMRNTPATMPTAKARAFLDVIFSSVKICAITMVNSGFMQIRAAAVAALHLSTPSWKHSMLTGIPMAPTRVSHLISAALRLYPFS